ncbi:MAG TPA: GldG family protein [bacterium]|nr:GldG family protein [bacterium]HPN30203.1 GldG family protein [bacterium]
MSYTAKRINFSITVLLTAAIIIMINYLAYRHYMRLDWTKTNIFSLSEYSEKILDKIQKRMSVSVFIPSNAELYENIQELLNSYANYNKNIVIEYIDPIKNQLRSNELAKKYNLTSPDLVIFEFDDQIKYVSYNNMADYEYIYGKTPKISSFKGEEKFTSIILSLIEKEQKTIYFTEGHNERKLESSETYDGFEILKNEILEKGNFKIKTLPTVATEKIPEDCSLLVILAPEFDFLNYEIKIIADYLKSGGKILICLEPSIGKKGNKLVLLTEFLNKNGIRFHNNLLIDPSNNYPLFGKGSIVAFEFGQSEITKFHYEKKIPVIFNLISSLEEVKTENGIKSTVLIKSQDSVFAKENLEDLKNLNIDRSKYPQKNYDIAILSESDNLESIEPDSSIPAGNRENTALSQSSKKRPFALLAVGDADFLSNNLINNAGNSAFIINAVNYLVEKKDLISLPPKSPEKAQLTLASNDMFFIIFVSIFAMPALSVLTGILVWWRRKK